MRNSPRSIGSAIVLVGALVSPATSRAIGSEKPDHEVLYSQCMEELGLAEYIADLGTDAAKIGDKHDCPTAGYYEQTGHRVLAKAEQGQACTSAIVHAVPDERVGLKTKLAQIRAKLARILESIAEKCPGFEAAAECRERIDYIEELVVRALTDGHSSCSIADQSLSLAKRKLSSAEAACEVVPLEPGKEAEALEGRLEGVAKMVDEATGEHNRSCTGVTGSIK